MEAIMQGTTPTLSIAIDPNDFLLSNVSRVELYVWNGVRTNKYSGNDLVIDTTENKLIKTFTERETAAFRRDEQIEVQARFWFPDGSVVGINKIRFDVADMLGVGN